MHEDKHLNPEQSRVENLAKQLKETGEEISNTAIMTKILSTLPSKYRSLRQAWLSLDPHSQTIQNLTARLLDEEASLTNEEESESALVAMKHSKPQRKFQNHNMQKISTSGQNNQHRFICYNCNKRGHFARDCRAPKKSERKPQEQKMLAFSAEQCLQSEADIDTWILDSGASAHMSYRRDYFSELMDYGKNSGGTTVRLGNKKELVVQGCGNILINRCVNGKWEKSILEDVLYVPELRRNLFSEGMATRKGYVIIKKYNEALILKDNTVVMTATLKQNNLYEVNIKTTVQIDCNVAQSSLKIWHERLGHLNLKEVKNMSKNGAIPVKLTDDINFVCEGCQYGKRSRLPFHKSCRGECEPGDLTYSDVCGPVEHTSVSGARYFVLFKDGATSYRHVFIIKHKSDVLDCFKKYNAIVKNKFGHGTRILHTDNGREYVNNELKSYLNSEGIVHERTAPYTPEQNGRVEREMRTIMESARSMLYSRDISLDLWAEAVNCAVYLLNRSSSTQTKDVSPYELWNGQKPALQHIRVFGSEGYVHIPDERRRKLDKKSVRLILVGYENENYRMFDIESGKITISRNVHFNENNIPVLRKHTTSISITDEQEQREGIQDIPVSPGDNQNISESSFESVETQEDSNDVTYQPPQIISEDDERNITLRPRRKRNEEANFIELDVPTTYEEAINCKNSNKWKEAICEELESLKENKTWKLVNRNNEKTVTSKWVFCVKRNSDGDIERYKARLCARGFTQTKNVDYKETFSPTTRFDSIRIILSLAARENYELQQFDVKTAFLYGELSEDVYMEVPEGVHAEPRKICKLIKSIYGLKQSSRCWNRKFSSFLTTYGFEMCPSDNCIFVGHFNNYKVILILYVDDALLLSKSKSILLHIINDLKQSFKIKEFNLNMFVGMEITKNDGIITLSQKQYIKQIINRFNMSDANPCSTPADNNVILKKNDSESNINFPYREAVGALMFLSTVSRPDISYSLNVVSRYLNNPSKDHVNAVKRIIRYLLKTKDVCITYNCNKELVGFSDSDFASDIDSRKSNTGYIFMMNGGPVSWASRKQNTVALSTTESEYMAASEAAKEILWLRQLLIDIDEPQLVITLCIDNQSAIKLIHNPIYHKRTKHIDIRYNFIREKVEQNVINVQYVKSSNQLADFLTKALPSGKFILNRDQVLNIN
ncbi:unnamed protein product [Parnassius mnemosyne]|uniref:Retrovirus-related Pol polyprotein from transposon TNT 1-94 n=1 Tax=Parnassius mnemosyne TaxID=213953 RepID=A0AAV1LKM9_9NEOP